MHERAHALDVGLLQHEAAAYVGMVDDLDARGGLVHHLRELGALHAGLGVVERGEVAGRELRDGLGADHHAGVLDDHEHLRDAVVHVADEPADRRLLLAEGELAGRGDLQAHLLLDVGDVDAVALADLAGLEVDVELRHEEEGEALGARAALALDADGAGEDEVDDVVGHVVLGGGDEALHALDAPRAVVIGEGLGATGADVGARVGLGEHHGGAPLLVDHELGPALLVGVADAIEDRREAGTRHVHERRGVGAEEHLGRRPAQRGRGARTAEVLGQVESPPLGIHQRAVGLLEVLRHLDGVGRRVVLRRIAVRGEVGLRKRAGREALDLAERFLRGLRVHLGVRAGAQPVGGTEHLEEVELDVPEVGAVVRHGNSSLAVGLPTSVTRQ